MAARNKPAGIRSLVYGIGKGKGGIEGLSVSFLDGAEIDYPLGLNGSLRPLAGSRRNASRWGQSRESQELAAHTARKRCQIDFD